MQLSAQTEPVSTSFNQFILPEGDIDPKIKDLIHMSVQKRGGKRVLTNTKSLQVLPTGSSEEVLKNFLDWLESVGGGKQVVLVAHNAHAFDMRRLLFNLIESSLYERAASLIKGFVDTLPMFRDMFQIKPNEKGKLYIDKL